MFNSFSHGSERMLSGPCGRNPPLGRPRWADLPLIMEVGLVNLAWHWGTSVEQRIQTPRLAILQESWQILLYVVEDYRSKDFTLA